MDDQKKPGQRDISDLKARLGLKKTAAMPAPAQAPPSSSLGSAPIPSPFGQPAHTHQPPPQAEAPPDPRRDPFAAQQAANLAAFYGIGQAIPGSADSEPAQSMSRPKAWGRIIGFLFIAGVAFGVGSSFGAIYKERVEFNHTTEQAEQISEEIKNVSKQTERIRDTVRENMAKGELPLAQALGALDLKKPDQSKLFHTNYARLEDVAIDRLFNYYNHTIQLYDLVRLHASRTENDKEAIDRAAKSTAAAGDKKYGVIVNPRGGLQVAQFVEMGQPTCPTPQQTDCAPNEWKGFKYRVDPSGGWGERPLKGAVNGIVMPLERTALFNTVAAGNPDILSLRDYQNRMKGISELLAATAAEEKEVKKDMERAASRPKVFTF